jgi:hypothetical protein
METVMNFGLHKGRRIARKLSGYSLVKEDWTPRTYYYYYLKLVHIVTLSVCVCFCILIHAHFVIGLELFSYHVNKYELN